MYKLYVKIVAFDNNEGIGISNETRIFKEEIEDGMENLMKLLGKYCDNNMTLSSFKMVYESLENSGKWESNDKQAETRIGGTYSKLWINTNLVITKE